MSTTGTTADEDEADKATDEGDSTAGTGTPSEGSSKAGTETTGRDATADTIGEGGVSSTGATELQNSFTLRALRSSTGNEVTVSDNTELCVERREGERTRLSMSFAKAGERQWKA